MRFVLDTVVVVRALFDRYGWAGTLLFEYSAPREWVVSPDIVDEYLDVVNRPHIRQRFRAAPPRSVEGFMARLETAIRVVPSHLPAVCRDPNDDKFLAAALAGGASFIVSEDKDLLALGSYEGIEICPVETFLRHLAP